MSNAPGLPNPFESPQFGMESPTVRTTRDADRLPGFCLAMAIVDLVFTTIRMPIVAFGVVGLMAAKLDPQLARTGIFEIATGAAMILFGFPADIAMLCKHRAGALLGWFKVAATVASIGVGVWQIQFILGSFPPGSPQYVGGIVGGLLSFAIRAGLVGLYVAALVKFANWQNSRQAY